MADLIYQVDSLVKSYNGRQVLSVPALEVQRGEILGLVGPSGAGKSTFLRLLNFLEAPSAGRIAFAGRWFGQPDTLPLALRRRAVLVFQRPVLLSGSVFDNVAYGLRIRGCRNVRSTVEAVLARIGLLHLKRAASHTLSGGELQRVALARALVVEPEVLLLDEPTANLDPAHVRAIEAMIMETNQAAGTTVVIVTHNVFQARRLAQRVGLLVGGRLVEVAPAQEFFESPQTEEACAFVRGDMIY
ncbi:MAG TPA: phosphate ABC transporter ATP-binding protein [Anaerolineae bacterium]|nr:phosphate ABC transporter ATP-binding protein [Anaerolineae bacterium]HOR00199.1 phosphate ABC transporter ATP-binding protein [Anaerolineae bacterium]HPL28462.1 phosphate ABC transporter ATP-binding protein [Anaerolineae bacterium]